MAQVEEICDSVTVLHHGKVVFAGGLSVMREDAPEPVWRMRTSDDAAAMEAIRAVTGVKAATRDEGGLSVYAVQDRLDEYVLHLGRQGVAVHGLELEVTPLESLFFQLTAEPAESAEPGPTESVEPAEPAEPGPAEPAPAGGRPVPQEAP